MTPKCSVCGHRGVNAVKLVSEKTTAFAIERHWGCERGHEFITLEVPPTFVASKQFRENAEKTITKRISRWERDQQIKAQYVAGRTLEQLSLTFDLTKTRIAQILNPLLK